MAGVTEQVRGALEDRYEIERELGRGGMATVYLAHDRRHGRRVAIKVLHGALAGGAADPERFLREIRIAARLVHPGIVPLHDSGESDGVLYYVMPHLDSETLGSRLAREGRIDTAEALRITTALARAIDYAHRQGIVHRDIKPSNVFLHEGEPVLADFGVARAMFALGVADGLTGVGWAVGTPQYMSPEQAVADSDVDGRSDQYSLACLLYEMLAGAPPFTGDTRAVMLRHIVEPAPSIAAQHPEVSPAVESALAKALAKSPNERFSTVGEFAAALATDAPQAPALAAGCSVAVLPFLALGGDADTEYLSDGLTDELISALSGVEGLRVASRNSVFIYKGREQDVRRVAAELGVEYVIEGSVRQVGRRLRVRARLTSAPEDKTRRSLRYDRDADDVLALEDELAMSIVDELRPTLIPGTATVAPAVRTKSAEAHRLYLKGRFAWNKRTYEDTDEAIKYFEEAIKHDPGYALAYSGLADAHALQLDYRHVPVSEGMARAKEYALKALELDERLAEAHASLAWVLFIHDWDWKASLAQFERAIALSPNYGTARQWYAMPLSALRQFSRARAESQIAAQLDPASVSARRVCAWSGYYARRFDEAILHAERALTMNPTSEESHRLKGFALLANGDPARAAESFEEGLLNTPDVPYALAGLAGAKHGLGESEAARDILQRLQARAAAGYVPAAAFVILHASLGNVDKAVDWLEKARAERRGFVAYMAVNPLLDPLRVHTRFAQIQRAMGL
ncbi:MAG: protein kinase domain-containing protein [Gemmatimonadaceae bacterium]